jgi:outer membrane biosynthesis protein TonB
MSFGNSLQIAKCNFDSQRCTAICYWTFHLSLTPRFSGVCGTILFALTVLTVFLHYPTLHAQTADDYFHGGATNYVFGQKEKAKEQIVTGLQAFPTDPKLNQLLVLLKKEEEQKQKQQQQQQQQQQNKNDQNKDQKQKKDQKKDADQKKDSQQNQSNDQKKEQEKKQQEQAKKNTDQKKNQEKKDQQTADQKKQDKSDQNDRQEPQPAYAPGQMTPQQAKQLLDAQKGDEMMIPLHPPAKPRDSNKPLKDW